MRQARSRQAWALTQGSRAGPQLGGSPWGTGPAESLSESRAEMELRACPGNGAPSRSRAGPLSGQGNGHPRGSGPLEQPEQPRGQQGGRTQGQDGTVLLRRPCLP